MDSKLIKQVFYSPLQVSLGEKARLYKIILFKISPEKNLKIKKKLKIFFKKNLQGDG